MCQLNLELAYGFRCSPISTNDQHSEKWIKSGEVDLVGIRSQRFARVSRIVIASDQQEYYQEELPSSQNGDMQESE